MKKIFVIALMATLCLSASAQRNHKSSPQEYAYGSSLELQGGFSASIYSVLGETGTARSLAGGGDFNFRYTYFPGRHWGFFVSAGLNANAVDATSWLKTQNKADGGRYTYSTYQKYSYDCCGSYYDHTMEQSSLAHFIVGAVYRYDFGQWSLRPRVGIGVGGYDFYSDAYISYTRDASEMPSWHLMSVRNDALDFIHGEQQTNYGAFTLSPVFVATGSLQLTYTIGRHFFFSLEGGCKASPNRIHITREDYKAKSAYDPQSWVEAVYDSSSRGYLVRDEDSMHPTQYTRRVGIAFNLSAGIGWNIGWNRYESGKYSR